MILENLSEIGQQLNEVIYFLNDIKDDLRIIKSKIDDIKKNVSGMSNDLKYLRGKNVFQLFEIRCQKVEYEKKKIELTSIFVDLKTKEKDLKNDTFENVVMTDLLTLDD